MDTKTTTEVKTTSVVEVHTTQENSTVVPSLCLPEEETPETAPSSICQPLPKDRTPVKTIDAHTAEASYPPAWPYSCPAEDQKRLWYLGSLGMGVKKIADEWGFSSANASRNVSRSHTPSNEQQYTGSGNPAGLKK